MLNKVRNRIKRASKKQKIAGSSGIGGAGGAGIGVIVGGAIGGAIGIFGGPVGVAIGATAGAAVGGIFGGGGGVILAGGGTYAYVTIEQKNAEINGLKAGVGVGVDQVNERIRQQNDTNIALVGDHLNILVTRNIQRIEDELNERERTAIALREQARDLATRLEQALNKINIQEEEKADLLTQVEEYRKDYESNRTEAIELDGENIELNEENKRLREENIWLKARINRLQKQLGETPDSVKKPHKNSQLPAENIRVAVNQGRR
jgi:hypothetical protein